MKKPYLWLLYFISWVAPFSIIFMIGFSLHLELKYLWVMPLCLSYLLSSEIAAEDNDRKFIWSYISESKRDKFAFAISLTIFFIPSTMPWQVVSTNIAFSQIVALISMLIGTLIAIIVFLVIATPKFKHHLLSHVVGKIYKSPEIK